MERTLLEQRPMLRWLWLTALVLLLDYMTKGLAEAHLAFNEPVSLLPFLDLRLLYNTGAAFSLLADGGGWQRWLFALLAVAVSVALVVWLARLSRGERSLAAGLALIIGGALGNLVDRLGQGYVVDFVDLHYAGWHWPAFNVADAAITIGAVLVVWDAFRSRREEES
ncbi:MAG: signal peptidase II [Pseudomonadota bacterium]